jgi:hypothetical protein
MTPERKEEAEEFARRLLAARDQYTLGKGQARFIGSVLQELLENQRRYEEALSNILLKLNVAECHLLAGVALDEG